MIRKLAAELDCVVTWRDLVGRLPDALLVAQELFGMLHLLLVFNELVSTVAVVLHVRPEAHKAILGASFDLKGDTLGVHDWRDDAHEDSACHRRTWLIERLVHGHLHVALATVSLFVSEQLHYL